MRALVRDDIISLDNFVAAEFKYKKYLEMLNKAGGYCFMQQFKMFFKEANTVLKGMQEKSLIGTTNINKNYKYIYLTDPAIKYLDLRDVEKDYTSLEKSKISVRKLSKSATEKQLLSCAYKFHLLATEQDTLEKESILENLKEQVYNKLLKGSSMQGKIIVYKDFLKIKEVLNAKITEINLKIRDMENKRGNLNKIVNKLVMNTGFDDDQVERKKIKELNERKLKIAAELGQLEKTLLKKGLNEHKLELEFIEDKIKELKLSIKQKDVFIENYAAIEKETSEEIEVLSKSKKIYEKKFNQVIDIDIKADERFKMIKKRFENLYNISKIFIKIENDILNYTIFDVGTFRNELEYCKELRELKELLGIDKFKIIIYSYSKNRSENLAKSLNNLQNRRDTAAKSLEKMDLVAWSSRDGGKYKKIISEIPEFVVELKEEMFYIATFKSILSDFNREIKFKDRKIIKDLSKKIK